MRWQNPIDLALAPIHWLERSRGWRRLVLLLVYAGIVVAGGAFGTRWMNIIGVVPGIADPFDVAQFERDRTPASAKLSEAYFAALAPLRKQTLASSQSMTNGRYVTDWAMMDEQDRVWWNENTATIEPWLAATSLPLDPIPRPAVPDALHPDPADDVRYLARVALIEGSKREAAGDLAGAWVCYRSVLRGSRQVARFAPAIRRQIGYGLLKMADPRIQVWSREPNLTAAQVRRALDDLTECIKVSPRPSDTVKAEAIEFTAQIDLPQFWESRPKDRNDPKWYELSEPIRKARWFLRGEPARSQRVLRLLTAQALAQCDRDPSERPPMVPESDGIWTVDSQTPPVVAQFTPERLNQEVKESVQPGMTFSVGGWSGLFTDEVRVILRPFQFSLAERLYRMERGKPPVRARDLLDGYVDQLPFGMDPEEPLDPMPPG